MTDYSLSSEHLRLLAQTDSPTIANVIELFGIRSQVAGYTNHTVQAVYPELPPAVGYAVTATLRTGYPKPEEEPSADMEQFLEHGLSLPEPRIAVIQDLDDPPRAATYGEVMASSMQAFGFAGVIASGAGRDLEQVRRLRFPCWASGLLVSHGHPRLIEIGVPVMVGGLSVRSGDLLHADGNGIIHIPHRIAAGVAELCAPYIEAEQIILDSLKMPPVTLESYRAAVERALERIAALRTRAQQYLAESGKA